MSFLKVQGLIFPDSAKLLQGNHLPFFLNRGTTVLCFGHPILNMYSMSRKYTLPEGVESSMVDCNLSADGVLLISAKKEKKQEEHHRGDVHDLFGITGLI